MSDRGATLVLTVVTLLLALGLFRVWNGAGYDENGYHNWLTSVLLDGDLDLSNDLMSSTVNPDEMFLGSEFISDAGVLRPHFSIGPSVLEFPAVLVAALIESWRHESSLDRHAWPLRAAVSLIGLGLGFHGLLLVHSTLRRFHGAGTSAAAAGLAVFGSPALAYMTLHSAMAHAHSLWASAVVWWLTVKLWDESRGECGALSSRRLSSDWALGLAIGLGGLLRWSALVWGAPAAMIYLLRVIRGPCRRRALTRSLMAAGAATLVFSIQLAAWNATLGSPFSSPHGSTFFRDMGSWALTEVLFSRWYGLLTSHPWLILALIGLPLWVRRAPALGLGGIVSLSGLWMINASVRDWWGGVAFGGRRWCEAMPLLAFGFASMLELLPGGTIRRAVGIGVTAGLLGLNAALAILWSRELVAEDWWGHFPIFRDLAAAVTGSPLALAEGDLWTLSLLRPSNAHVSLALGAGIFVTVLTPWLLGPARGLPPWPRRGAGRLTALATAHVITCLVVVISAGLRAPHVESHLRLRGVLRSAAPGEFPWPPLDRSRLESGHTSPLILLFEGSSRLVNGEQQGGADVLRRLESVEPRTARLQVLRLSASAELRRQAALALFDLSRWQDPEVERMLTGASVALGLAPSLSGYTLSPAASLDAFLAGRAAIAQGASLEEHERDLRWHLWSRHPFDQSNAFRLMDLLERSGDHDRARAVCDRLSRLSGVRLECLLRLLESHPGERPDHLLAAVQFHGLLHLQTLDMGRTVSHAETTAARVEAVGGAVWGERFRQSLFACQWEAARAARGDELRNLSDAILRYAALHPDRVDSQLARIEVLALGAHWIDAIRAAAAARHAFPSETNWFSALWVTTAQMSIDDVVAAGSMLEEIFKEAEQPLAWVALAHRATALQEHGVALTMWRQAAGRGFADGEIAGAIRALEAASARRP